MNINDLVSSLNRMANQVPASRDVIAGILPRIPSGREFSFKNWLKSSTGSYVNLLQWKDDNGTIRNLWYPGARKSVAGGSTYHCFSMPDGGESRIDFAGNRVIASNSEMVIAYDEDWRQFKIYYLV